MNEFSHPVKTNSSGNSERHEDNPILQAAEGLDYHPTDERQAWLAIRKEAGLNIDPETAEVMWEYGYTIDPYNEFSDLSEEEKQIGRNYFARSPGSEIWVSFCDLPDATLKALQERPISNPEFSGGPLRRTGWRRRIGCPGIGIEIDQHYAETAAQRIREEC